MKLLIVSGCIAASLAASGTAMGAAFTAWQNARAYVEVARPAAEDYRYDHGNSWKGMTGAALKKMSANYGPIDVRVVWATKTDYCIQHTTAGVSAHAFAVTRKAANVLHGACPPRKS